MTTLAVTVAQSALDIEQVRDIRRSVLCGELNWPRELVQDPSDTQALLVLASLGAKPVGSARLIKRDSKFQIEVVAVLERFRRQGIGRAMLVALESRAKGELLVMHPGPDTAFFERCGYVRHKGVTALIQLEKCLP